MWQGTTGQIVSGEPNWPMVVSGEPNRDIVTAIARNYDVRVEDDWVGIVVFWFHKVKLFVTSKDKLERIYC